MSAKVALSLCPYCAVGCGMYLVVDKGKAVGIEYMTDHPAGEGAVCPKGNAVLEVLNSEERLKHPLKRSGDGFVAISWEEALHLVAEGLSRNIKKHGAGSLGFLASSRCNNEENYLFQKMARLLGSPHVDNCARLCHSPTVVGLGAVLGTGAMTNNLPDLENSKCIFAIGTNFTEAHPVVSRWVQKARDRGATIIVADPRITSTSWTADVHLRINPGSDIDLLRGMMKVIVEEGLWIINEVGRRLGMDLGGPSAEQVLREINRNVPQYGGMTKERISKVGGLRWPCPDDKHPGTDILHRERFSTPSGRANIATVENRPAAEAVSPDYPILLSTGRIVEHYNSGSMTRRSPSLNEVNHELYVEINPQDAARLGVRHGDMVKVKTVRGETEARARITEKVKPGMVFMPFHWQGTNIITSDALDPVAKIPEYKMAACRIEAMG